jgi:hypothetical protein
MFSTENIFLAKYLGMMVVIVQTSIFLVYSRVQHRGKYIQKCEMKLIFKTSAFLQC